MTNNKMVRTPSQGFLQQIFLLLYLFLVSFSSQNVCFRAKLCSNFFFIHILRRTSIVNEQYWTINRSQNTFIFFFSSYALTICKREEAYITKRSVGEGEPGQEQLKINVDGGFNLIKQFNVGCDLAQNSRDSVSVSLVPQGLAISRYCNSLWFTGNIIVEITYVYMHTTKLHYY